MDGMMHRSWAKAADTRAALMDGCWRAMTFQIIFELNANIVLEYTGCSQFGRLWSSPSGLRSFTRMQGYSVKMM